MRKNSQENPHKQKTRTSQKKQDKNKELASIAYKKTKSGLAKIKKNIQHTVNAKNIMKLIKQSTRLIPHLLTRQQSKALLPKLQVKMIPTQNQESSIVNRSKFQEIEDQLTHSMVMFKKTAELQRNDLWAIQLQTQKCYKTIPSIYFQHHPTPQQLTRHLTFPRSPHHLQQTILNLTDYLDQVQFNINEQANAKIKMFMNFVLCTNSIQDLININLSKLARTRKHIGILRDIIVSRSVRINQHRLRYERLEEVKEVLMLVKRLKIMEGKLNAQIAIGNFIPHDARTKIGALFYQYCQLHNVQLKKFCCKTGKNICKYWDITYYVQRGFQQNFIKMIKSYLLQLINPTKQIQTFKKHFTAPKKNFMSTPSPATMTGPLDESFQIDAFDHVELITKIHIQKQIVSHFQQGMHKYSFSTEGLEKDIKEAIGSYLNVFLREVLAGVDQDFRITLKDLGEQEGNFMEGDRCKEKIVKATWGQFNKIMEMVMLRFQYLNIRLLSLIQKLLQKASTELQSSSPQRYQVFSVYMLQLISSQISTSDSYIEKLLKYRLKDCQKSITLFKSKQDIVKQYDIECQTMKKLVSFCNKWINIVENLEKDYKICWGEYNRVWATERKIGDNGGNKWCGKVEGFKGFLVKSSYEILHKTIVSRDLKQKLQQDRWQYVQIKTHIYNDLGYILGGKQFQQQQQRHQRESLPKSILMDKSLTEVQSSKYNKQEYSLKFKINPSYITIQGIKIKLTSSTQQIIQFLYKYLQLYDDIVDGGNGGGGDMKKKADLHGKLTEFVLMYNQFVKELVIKGEAIKLGVIKSKSITAKHLIVCYVQLEAVMLVFCGQILEKRVGFNKQDFTIMRDKITMTQNQVRKKYQKIIQLRIMQSIESLNLKDQNWLQSSQMQSIPKNIQSSVQLFTQLFLYQKQYQKFLDMDPNWAAELLSKVGKGPKGKQNKIKCFTFLAQQIKPYIKYLPKLTTAVKSVLN